MRKAYLLALGVPMRYSDALALQSSLAAGVSDGRIADTVVFLEHEPVITLGRRTDESAELHLPLDVDVDVVETNRGGKSTYHGPGQLVCYPILDLNRHGRDLRKYVRDLEAAIIRTLGSFGIAAERIEGLTGAWMPPRDGQGPRKIASIGVHASRWITTHGYALNVDLDLAPFTQWITACGLADAQFTSMQRELGRHLTVDEVRPVAAAALAEVFGLELQPLPAEHAAGLGAEPFPGRLRLADRPRRDSPQAFRTARVGGEEP